MSHPGADTPQARGWHSDAISKHCCLTKTSSMRINLLKSSAPARRGRAGSSNDPAGTSDLERPIRAPQRGGSGRDPPARALSDAEAGSRGQFERHGDAEAGSSAQVRPSALERRIRAPQRGRAA